MQSVFRIARRNARKNWRNSLASILAIATACVSICVFQGFYTDAVTVAYHAFSRPGMMGQVVIQRAGAAQTMKEDPLANGLSPTDQAFLDAFLKTEADNVEARVRWLSVSGMVNSGPTTTVFVGYGLDLEEAAKMRGPDWAWNALYGVPLEKAGLEAPVGVGMGLAEMLDCEAATEAPVFLPSGSPDPTDRPFKCARDTVQLQATTPEGQFNATEARIVSIVDAGFRELEDKFMIMPLPMARSLMGTDDLSLVSVRLTDGADVPAFLARLNAAARAKGVALEAQPWEEHPVLGDLYRRSVEQVALLRVVMILVLVSVGLMSVINTVSRSIIERSREIGSLRSIGFKRRHIVAMFALEGFMASLIACGLGLVVTLVVSTAVSHAGLFYPPGVATYPLPMRIPLVPGAYLLVTLGLCLASGLAAVLPARKAAHMKIVDALGHV